MRPVLSLLSVVVLSAAFSFQAMAEPAPLNETAQLLAGTQTEQEDIRLSERFLEEAEKAWSLYDRRIAKPMIAWGKSELPDHAGETIFYPFSGPDFLTVYQLFPDAGRYVLVAVQPAGPAPNLREMKAGTQRAYFAFFQDAWTKFSRRGFFRTEDLKSDTGKKGTLDGITPVLMAFSAKLGYSIQKVEPIRVKKDGSGVELHPGDRKNLKTWDSVRLSLEKDGREVILDYLDVNLADGGLRARKNEKAWLGVIAQNPTLVKAASHLMQKSFFSMIRDTLLEKSPLIVSDETGISYEEMSKHFDVALYGQFVRSHRLWSEDTNSSLVEAYENATDIKKLGFKFGYEKNAGSCLTVAKRK